MASFGEEELVQMVRDFIETAGESTSLLPTNPFPHKPQSTLQDVLEATDFETQVLEKVLMYVRNMKEPNSLKKWVVMRLQMDGYEASLCRSSWFSTLGPKVFHCAGDYEYIDVMIGENNRLIVDMDFRSQFELARPTQSYKDLLNSLPSVFVGTEERLNKVISLLCSAAKQSLKENGLHIPPWRKTKYMQSKWLAKNCKKVSDMSSGSEHYREEEEDDNDKEGSPTCCPSIF